MSPILETGVIVYSNDGQREREHEQNVEEDHESVEVSQTVGPFEIEEALDERMEEKRPLIGPPVSRSATTTAI
jgi:hypothetical protein